jgi:hypothetical protein
MAGWLSENGAAHSADRLYGEMKLNATKSPHHRRHEQHKARAEEDENKFEITKFRSQI